jgi:hypothetical protein
MSALHALVHAQHVPRPPEEAVRRTPRHVYRRRRIATLFGGELPHG